MQRQQKRKPFRFFMMYDMCAVTTKRGTSVNKEFVQMTLDYIEDNLKTDINAEELSKMAGYSLFHFYRLFQNAVGMPVMQYITRRKLLNAIYDISLDNRKTDIIMAYGYETYSGFYKSFFREIGYTPKDYLERFKVKKPYRINLIEEEHIIMSHKRIAEILKKYGLEKETISDIVYEGTGNINESSYYVGDKYIVKFTANLGAVKKAVSLTEALNNFGLVTAAVIQTTTGADYVEEEGLYFFVTTRIQGERINADNLYFEDYNKNVRFIGEVIGQLSLALRKVDAVVDDRNLLETVKDWAIPTLSGKLNISRSFEEHFMKQLSQMYPDLPKQIIHRDPNPGNIIISGEEWGFIDFDLSERNVRIYDPCYAAAAILSESFEVGNNQKLAKWINIYHEIMIGFDSVAKLSNVEKEAIPYIILANQFIATAYFSEHEKYHDIYEVNAKMTEWMIKNFEMLSIM